MCRSRLWLLYWVSTQILRMPPLARLDSAKSISRYRAPNGTAGFARSAVSGLRRVPAPPASTMPRTDLLAMSGPPQTRPAAYGAAASGPCSPLSVGTGKSSPGAFTGSSSSACPGGGSGGFPGRGGGIPRLPDENLQRPGDRDGQQGGHEAAEQPADQAAQGRADQDRD